MQRVFPRNVCHPMAKIACSATFERSKAVRTFGNVRQATRSLQPHRTHTLTTLTWEKVGSSPPRCDSGGGCGPQPCFRGCAKVASAAELVQAMQMMCNMESIDSRLCALRMAALLFEHLFFPIYKPQRASTPHGIISGHIYCHLHSPHQNHHTVCLARHNPSGRRSTHYHTRCSTYM